MTIEQTIEVPASRRITLEVPPQIPVGPVILTFTPLAKAAANIADECPECAKHSDPETGELRFNAETVAAIEEGRAMMRGEVPAQQFGSLEELLADLRS